MNQKNDETQPVVPINDLVPIKRVCDDLNISRSTLYRWVDTGILSPIYKLGRRSYFRRSEIEACLAQMETYNDQAKASNAN